MVSRQLYSTKIDLEKLQSAIFVTSTVDVNRYHGNRIENSTFSLRFLNKMPPKFRFQWYVSDSCLSFSFGKGY